MNKLLLLAFILAFFISPSCKKDSFIQSSDARIGFSADSLQFDTVFTSTGSVTQSVKIINLNDQKLMLSDIRLSGGTQSPFSINTDGSPGPELQDIEIAANDSIYIFVTVKINPSSANLPFIIRDSIEVSYNSNQRWIQLEAWGQNAHFLQHDTIHSNTVWTNDLPYVILGSLLVDTQATLTIQKGTRIYFHADAPLLVDGTLLVNGEKEDSTRVYFLGDRLDDPYKNYPGSWPGIFFRTGCKDNLLEFAVIRNAYQGIVAQDPSLNANPKLVLHECIIDNIYNEGILGIQTSIQARNCLVSNAGSNVVLGYGGDYLFQHCTLASYSNNYLLHQAPVLAVCNYLTQGSQTFISDLNAQFTNCIFWGDSGVVDNEVLVSKQGNSIFDVNFDHCLWRAKNIPTGVDTSGIMLNADPAFLLINNQKMIYNFRLAAGSPAIDQGIDAGDLLDLDGNIRPIGLPDLGCYEKQ
ncbi:MAG: choice-of-anchor Q domain-containing protein [Chitinophagales bacterium]